VWFRCVIPAVLLIAGGCVDAPNALYRRPEARIVVARVPDAIEAAASRLSTVKYVNGHLVRRFGFDSVAVFVDRFADALSRDVVTPADEMRTFRGERATIRFGAVLSEESIEAFAVVTF
jgi:hypothetical protein